MNKYSHLNPQDQPSVMHNARHPMRQNMTQVEDLFVDIHSEVKLSEVSEALSQSIRQMAARQSSDPAFWLIAFKFLNDFKDDMYTRLWTGKDEADHRTRLVQAQRCAAIQIRLLIRNKNLPPELQRALTYMFGPALALLMLRRSHERQERTLINAMQLVYDIIESYQETPVSLAPYNRPDELGLEKRMHDFFKNFTGIKRALPPEAITQLQADNGFFLTALGSDANHDQAAEDDHTVAQKMASELDINLSSATKNSTHLPPAEAHAPVFASITSETLEPLAVTTPKPVVDETSFAKSEQQELSVAATPSTHTLTPINPALDALLETIMKNHRFSWFQVQACKDCGLRRLMFGRYEREHRQIIMFNVRQVPSLTLSVVDFDAGLRAGFTRPLHDDDPRLNQILLDYLSSAQCEANA